MKTGACLIEVHLHVKLIGGGGGGEWKCLLMTGACLIQGLLKAGWTVLLKSRHEK